MEPRKCVSGAGSTMRLSQWNAYYLGSAEKLHKSNLGDTQCLKWGLRGLVFQIHPTIFYQSAVILNIYLP